MKRRGDWISEVKTKSGAPVTTCTSCPARIKCRTTYTPIPKLKFTSHNKTKQSDPHKAKNSKLKKKKGKNLFPPNDQSQNWKDRNEIQLRLKEEWEIDLGDSSGVAKSMSSDVVSEDEVLPRSGNAVTFWFNPHCAGDQVLSLWENDVSQLGKRNLCLSTIGIGMREVWDIIN
jgi:hypothetical protein